jgi:hypothetical protein
MNETIMPDGRPMFAWENELSMLRKAYPEAKKMMEEAKSLMKLLKIAEVETKNDIQTGDLLVRFRMVDAVTSMGDPLDKYQIIPPPRVIK